MIDESAHRQVCDALHRAIIGRDKAIAQRDRLLAACHKVVATYGADQLATTERGAAGKLDAMCSVIAAIRAAEGEGDEG
jgi:hypothetical protein